MKIRKQSLILFLIFCFSSEMLQAQQEQTLHFVRDIWQANLTNPALTTDKKVQILLPSVYFNFNSPDFTIQDLLKPDANGKLILHDVVKNRIKDQNRVDANFQFQTFGVSIQAGQALTFSAYHAVNGNPNFDLNRDLLKLAVEGNSQYLGKTVNLSSTANGSFYSELGLGVAYKFQEHISFGGRVKLLNGIAGVFTEKSKLNVGFDETNYNLTFDNDFDVKTYSFSKFSNIRKTTDLISAGFGKNAGFAFDLGASLTVGKLSFSASAIDLGGAIKWKDDGKGYASKGTYKYTGLNSDNFFKVDSFNTTSFKDTLKRVIGLTETANPTYTQKIPTKIYLSGTYKVSEKLDVGLLLFNESGGISTGHFGVAVNGSLKVLEFLTVGGTLGLRNSSFSNVGLHAVVKLGPVQLYGVTDNIIGAVSPLKAKTSNGRLGVNVVF